MKLFIRSQRKDCLREVHSIECNVDREGCCVLDGCYILGEYKTEKRCLEIIDEIQSLLVRGGTTDDKISAILGGTKAEFIVYEMPKG